MNLLEFLLTRQRFTLGIALLISLAGVMAWFTMPREEDPRLEERVGLILAPLPGADAEQVERLVVTHLEEELAEVDAVDSIKVTIRSSVGILNVELRDSTEDVDEAWARVSDAMDRAYAEMPESALKPSLNRKLIGTESVVIAVTGSQDSLELADAAKELRRHLLGQPGVSEVVLNGDPGEQLVVAFDEATAKRLKLSPEHLANLIGARNASIPGGAIRVANRRVELRPESELRSVEELRETRVSLPGGAALPLSSIAEVKRIPTDPPTERARMNGEPAVFVGVIRRRRWMRSSGGRESGSPFMMSRSRIPNWSFRSWRTSRQRSKADSQSSVSRCWSELG
ncbi:MAG: efflux RND transporter permease subunit [Polyangiaceae bacterium]